MAAWTQARQVWARVVGPSGVVAAGLVAHYAGNALALLVLARRVLPVEYGQYTAVLALVATTLALPGFGLDTWLLTRSAVSPPALAAIWRRALALRGSLLALWAVGLGGLWFWLPPSTYPGPIVAGVVVAGALESVALMTLAALRSRQDHARVALIQAAWAGGVLLLALLLPLAPGRLALFTTARAGLAAVATGSLIGWMGRRAVAPTGPTWRTLLAAGRPYFLSDLATLVYMRGDVVLTGLVLGAAAAAIYGPAINVLSLAYILPTSLFYAATPILSRFFGEGTGAPTQPKAFGDAAKQQLLRQAALGVALAGGLWLCAPLAGWLYGPGYEEVVWVLRLLAPIGLLRSLNFGLGAILIAAGRQAVRTRIQIGVAGLAVAGNLAVMPRLGVAGVAGVFVLCEMLLVLGYGLSVWQLRRRLTHAPDPHAAPAPVHDPHPR